MVIAAPKSPVWRIEISDAEVDGDSVKFVQKSFLRGGKFHPFNGVACNTIIRMVDANSMEMSITTIHAPEPEQDLLTRID